MNTSEYFIAIDVMPRVSIAIEIITLGKGDARERLKDAMTSIIPLRPEDFPKEHVNLFKKIIQDIGRLDKFKLSEGDEYLLKTKGKYHVYFRKIKNKTAVKYIKILYGIYQDLLLIIAQKY